MQEIIRRNIQLTEQIEDKEIILIDQDGQTLTGSGSGKQKQSSAPAFTRTPDTLRSADTVEVILALCEGPIGGLLNGGKTFYVGDTPLENPDGTFNFEYFELYFKAGAQLGGETPIVPALGGITDNFNVGTTLASGIPVTRQISTQNFDALDLRFTISQLFLQNDSGIYENDLAVEVRVKRSTDPSWGAPRATFNVNLRGKTTSVYVKEIRVPLRNTDQWFWQVQVTKISPDSTNAAATDIAWESYQAVQTGPRQFANTSTVQIIARATNQFSSVPQFSGIYRGAIIRVPTNYNSATKSYVGNWNGAFKFEYTDNPAWCLYDFIVNDRYGISSINPLFVDKYDFYEAAVWCDEVVSNGVGGSEPRFTFSDYIQELTSGLERARYIAGTMGGTVYDDGNGTLVLKVDRNDAASHLFTYENIEEAGFSYSYTDINTRFNDLTVSFKNPELNYEEDRRRVTNPTHIDTYGRIPFDFIAVGCNSESEALRRAYYRMNSATTETMMVSFKTNRLGSAVNPFDVILVSDSDLGYALSGRVKSLNVGRTQATLRDPLFLEAGVQYEAHFRVPQGIISRVVTTPSSGLVTQFNLTSALPEDVPEFCTFTLGQYNQAGAPIGIGAPKPFRVTNIAEVDGNPDAIEITAIELNRNKFEDSENQVVSTPTDYSAIGDPSNIPGPTSVSFLAVYSKSDNQVWTVVSVTFPNNQYRFYSGDFEVWTRRLVAGVPVGSFQTQSVFYGDTLKGHPAGPHEVKVVPSNTFGQTPPLALMPTWTYNFASTSQVGIPPKKILGLTTTQTRTGFYINWTIEPDQQDLVHHFIIREGATFETSVILANNVQEFFYLVDPMAKRSYTVWVSAVSIGFVEGPAETISFTNSAPLPPENLTVEVAFETIMIFFDRMSEVDIIGYRIQYRKVGETVYLDMNPSGLFDQGESDTAYEFRVAAQDPLTQILGDEIWGNPISARTRSTLSVEKSFDDVRQLTSVNLVRNGSFEQDLNHWVVEGVGGEVLSSPSAPYADPLNGTSKVLRLTSTTLVSKKFVIRPKGTFSVSVELLRATLLAQAGANHSFNLLVYNQNNEIIKEYTQAEGKRLIDPEELDPVEWRRFSSTFTIPELGVWASFKFTANGGYIFIDGVQVQKGNAATAFNPHVSEEISAEDLGLIAIPDLTLPNTPSAFTVSSSFRSITLTWSAPTNKPVATYQIFRNTVLIGTSDAPVFSDTPPVTAQNYSYQVRAVDANGNTSALSVAATGATTPLTSADYANLSIIGAKIADAAIDSAKISDLSAAKITSGTITAGNISVGSDRLRLEGADRRIIVLDELGQQRIILGRLGAGTQNYGIQVFSNTGQVVLDADGLGLNVVGPNQVLSGAIGTDKIATNAINADKIAANSITGVKILTNAIEARHVVSASITADKIAVGQLSAITANLGLVTAGIIKGAGLASTTNFWNLGTGEFWIGPANQSSFLRYDPITDKILIKGDVVFQATTVNWNQVLGRPMNLATLDPDRAIKIDGVQAGADRTSLNTAKDVFAVGGRPASDVSFWASDPAVRINQQTTTINGGKITTGSITANQIQVANLSAITANLGTIVAGRLQNPNNSCFINVTATGIDQFINCNNKFIVDALGNVYLENLQVNGNAIINGTITADKVAHGSLSANYTGQDQVFVPNLVGSEILIVQAVKYATLSPMQGGHPGLSRGFNHVIVTAHNFGNGPLSHLGGGPFLRAGLVQGGGGFLIDNTGTMTGLNGNANLTVYYFSQGSWWRLRGVLLYVTRLRR